MANLETRSKTAAFFSIDVMTTYLGIVDEVRTAVSGPKAFLRPVFKVEPGRSKWEAVESGEFPNRGLASWWKPLPSALKGTAWLFRAHESETFEQENQYHNLYNVSELADPATELIDASSIHAEEDLRIALCLSGLRAQPALTSRLVIRFGGGRLLGPVHGLYRDGRLHLPEESLNSHLTISLAGPLEFLAKFDGHCFLPLSEWSEKIGEVDFSPDSVFLKRALKELRSKDLASIKLTEGLMRQLVGESAEASLTVLERQRLERLKTWTANVGASVILTEEVIGEILELSAIREEAKSAFEAAKIDGRRAIEQELSNELTRIAAARAQLTELAEQRNKLLAELAEGRPLQEGFAKALEIAIEERIRSAMEKPQEFLAENAFIRASLSLGRSNPTKSVETAPPGFTHFDDLIGDHERFVQLLTSLFCKRGFRDHVPLALHASMLAGNIPLVYGVHAREVLDLYGSAVSRGNILWVPISPSHLEAADLLVSRTGGAQGSTPNPNGLLDLLKNVQSSNAIFLVVFEGVNRCFMQSAMEPIFRHLVARKQGSPTRPLIVMPHREHGAEISIGLHWPRNVLLAGTIVDERSLYPMNLSTWDVANWVFTEPYYDPKGRDLDLLSPLSQLAGVDADAWSKWEPQANEILSGDLKVFLRLTADKLLLDSSFYTVSARLHSVLSRINTGLKSREILRYVSELTLLPRCTNRLDRLKEILGASPFEFWQDVKGVDILQRLNTPTVAGTAEKETW
jgi:hypothetical protein